MLLLWWLSLAPVGAQYYPMPTGLGNTAFPSPMQMPVAPINQSYNTIPTGQLTGIVVDNNNRPLSGARVQLECGACAFTDQQGGFFFDRLPAGGQHAIIAMPGYNVGEGTVHIQAGVTKTLKVSLTRTKGWNESQTSSSSKAKGPQMGFFTVVGKALREGPRDHRWWVYKIEVHEIDNYNRSWDNTWWDDYDDVAYELKCDGAQIGRKYRIKITWRGHGPDKREYADDWDVDFTRSGQTFTFDYPR